MAGLLSKFSFFFCCCRLSSSSSVLLLSATSLLEGDFCLGCDGVREGVVASLSVALPVNGGRWVAADGESVMDGSALAGVRLSGCRRAIGFDVVDNRFVGLMRWSVCC